MTSRIKEIIDGHERRNSELLATLLTKGVDLDSQRSIDLHFWAPDREHAEALRDSLMRRGYNITRINDTSNDSELPWNIEAQADQSIAATLATEFTIALANLSDEHLSVYDGWGVAI